MFDEALKFSLSDTPMAIVCAFASLDQLSLTKLLSLSSWSDVLSICCAWVAAPYAFAKSLKLSISSFSEPERRKN